MEDLIKKIILEELSKIKSEAELTIPDEQVNTQFDDLTAEELKAYLSSTLTPNQKLALMTRIKNQ